MENVTDNPSPARLYASLAGALLAILGIVGFFYSFSFGSPGDVGEAFGLFAVNGWYNLLHIATGAAGLLVAGYAARRYALWAGALYLALGVWGLIAGGGESILGLLPIDDGNNALNLALGGFGLCAALATPRIGAKKPPDRRGQHPARAT